MHCLAEGGGASGRFYTRTIEVVRRWCRASRRGCLGDIESARQDPESITNVNTLRLPGQHRTLVGEHAHEKTHKGRRVAGGHL